MIGVEIHGPVDDGDAADGGGDGHGKADQWRRGAEEDSGEARGEQGGEEGLNHEAAVPRMRRGIDFFPKEAKGKRRISAWPTVWRRG